jgi:hypothetical protein
MSHAFQSHVRSTRHTIAHCERLLGRIEDPGAAFVLAEVLASEHRQHDLLVALSRDVIELMGAGSRQLAAPDPTPSETAMLLDAAGELLANKRHDREQLRWLHRQAAGAGGESMWPLIIELIEFDAATQLRLLDELRAQLHRQTRRGTERSAEERQNGRRDDAVAQCPQRLVGRRHERDH